MFWAAVRGCGDGSAYDDEREGDGAEDLAGGDPLGNAVHGE